MLESTESTCLRGAYVMPAFKRFAPTLLLVAPILLSANPRRDRKAGKTTSPLKSWRSRTVP